MDGLLSIASGAEGSSRVYRATPYIEPTLGISDELAQIDTHNEALTLPLCMRARQTRFQLHSFHPAKWPPLPLPLFYPRARGCLSACLSISPSA